MRNEMDFVLHRPTVKDHHRLIRVTLKYEFYPRQQQREQVLIHQRIYRIKYENSKFIRFKLYT